MCIRYRASVSYEFIFVLFVFFNFICIVAKKITEIAGAEASLQNLKTRMLAGSEAQNWTKEDMHNFLKGRSITDIDSLNLKEGDVLYLPEDGFANTYPRPFNNKMYPAIGCLTEDGKTKAVFLNTFHKSIPEYNSDATPKRTGKSAGDFDEGKDFYNKCMSCPTDDDLVTFLQGKVLKVVAVKKVKTAAWQNGSITGTRDGNLPCFQIVG